MRSYWKIAVLAICMVAICAAAITWQKYRMKAKERKLVDAAQVCRANAEQGNTIAEFSLGRMYYNGEGVHQDYTEAFLWYRKAADQGDVRAQYNLGCMYYDGKGVSQDYIEAARWFRKAVDRNDTRAQYSIGTMYYYGRGVPVDRVEAARWYRKAADQGLAKAQYDLGYLYYYGQGVPQDHAEADRWFHKAADQGDVNARQHLGDGLTTWRMLILLGELIGGMLLMAGFLRRGKGRGGFREMIAPLTGILCLLTAGLNWYGYTHYEIRWLLCGLNTFSLFKWLLNGVLVVLLIYILQSWKKASGVLPLTSH